MIVKFGTIKYLIIPSTLFTNYFQIHRELSNTLVIVPNEWKEAIAFQ